MIIHFIIAVCDYVPKKIRSLLFKREYYILSLELILCRSGCHADPDASVLHAAHLGLFHADPPLRPPEPPQPAVLLRRDALQPGHLQGVPLLRPHPPAGDLGVRDQSGVLPALVLGDDQHPLPVRHAGGRPLRGALQRGGPVVAAPQTAAGGHGGAGGGVRLLLPTLGDLRPPEDQLSLLAERLYLQPDLRRPLHGAHGPGGAPLCWSCPSCGTGW